MELLKGDDPNKKIGVAKGKTLNILFHRTSWKLFRINDAPENANIFGERFFVAFDDKRTDQEACKARFFRGYWDKPETSSDYDETTVLTCYTKLVIRIASIPDFKIFSGDVQQAYS